MTIAVIYAIVLIISSSGLATEESSTDTFTILFDDGTVLTGDIKEMNSNWVMIYAADGRIFRRGFDEIESISRGNVLQYNQTEKNRKALGIENHRFAIGIVSSDFNYEEPSLMEEKGALYGICARYSYRNNMDGMFQANFQVDFGEIAYDGVLWGGTPFKTDTDDYMIEFQAIGGMDCAIFNTHILTPFFGFGCRYWNDMIDGKTIMVDGEKLKVKGYEREIAYWYLPLGIQTISPISQSVSVGLTLEYDLFLAGKVTSHLSDVDDAYNDIYNDQLFGKGFGFKGSVQIRIKPEHMIGFIIEPFVSYWEMEDSEMAVIFYDPTTGGALIGYEPENTTFHYGVRAMIEF